MSTKTTTVTTVRACNCGCGTPTRKTGSLYVPGHDARHAGLVARAIVSGDKAARIDVLPSTALRAKAANMVSRMTAKPAKSAKATVKSVEPVKVGRWTYPAMRKGGVILRNTKRDGSGEWVAV